MKNLRERERERGEEQRRRRCQLVGRGRDERERTRDSRVEPGERVVVSHSVRDVNLGVEFSSETRNVGSLEGEKERFQ